MTTQTINCYKGFPIKISARARGYWDYEEIKSFDSTQTYDISLKPYDGLKYSFNESSSNTISATFTTLFLPNNKWAPEETKILMPYDNDKIYYNSKVKRINYYFKLLGCTVSEGNILSGFDKSFHAQITKAFPDTFTSFKMIFKASTGTSLSTHHNCILGNAGSSNKSILIRSSGIFSYYTGSWVNGQTVLEPNKTYWFCVNYANNTFTGYCLEDDGNYTLDTLPELDLWNEEWTSTINIFAGNVFNIGYNKYSTGEFFEGSFDLNNCKIWVDEEVFWFYNMITEFEENLKGLFYHYEDTGAPISLNCFYYNSTYILSPDENVEGGVYLGQVSVPEHDVYSYQDEPYQAYNNFMLVGTPTFASENQTCSNFSPNSYLDTGYSPILPAKTPWKMRVKFKYKATAAKQYYFSPFDYRYGMYISTQESHKINSGIGSGGTLIGNVVSDFTLEDGVNYIVEWVYNGDKTYTLRCQKEGEDFMDVGTIVIEKPILICGNLFIGRNDNGYCRGTIDLSDTFFEINGVKTWIPTATHYQSTWTRK